MTSGIKNKKKEDNNNVIYIEFLGLGGTGKSTISDLLTIESNKLGIKRNRIFNWDKDSKVKFLTLNKYKRHILPLFNIKNYPLIKLIFLYIFYSPKKANNVLYRQSLKNIIILNYLTKKKNLNYIITQEGPLKKLTTLKDLNYLISYIIRGKGFVNNHNFISKVYIYVSTDKHSLLLKRIKEDLPGYSGRVSLLKLSDKEILQNYAISQDVLNKNIKIIENMAKQSSNIHFIKLDGATDPSYNINIILNYFKTNKLLSKVN